MLAGQAITFENISCNYMMLHGTIIGSTVVIQGFLMLSAGSYPDTLVLAKANLPFNVNLTWSDTGRLQDHIQDMIMKLEPSGEIKVNVGAIVVDKDTWFFITFITTKAN